MDRDVSSHRSFLDIVDICDNFRISHGVEPLVPWALSSSSSSALVGLLRWEIVERLKDDDKRRVDGGQPALWTTAQVNGHTRLCFAGHCAAPSQRSAAVREICERWRDEGLFADVIGPRKWRDELYPVYLDPFGPHVVDAALYAQVGMAGEDEIAKRNGNYAFSMERAACALFGVVTYGVHMTMYTTSPSLGVWVAERSKTKQTWPGYLDNTVAGGIPTGMGMLESMVKECMEEASIDEKIVLAHARCVGSVSYFFRTSAGWLQPEIQFVYDLPVPPDDTASIKPEPQDGEVNAFQLETVDAVIANMRAGKFKPNCALVLLDFLVRHGHITPDDEPHYMEIVTRLHGRFEFDRW